jgi:HD-GYP domain-containing protein (c-di-GMP phosphodiesterase class II)
MFNVSTYCVALAKLLGVDDETELERIAVGGLLHDMCKLAIPPYILNKTTPLTPEERAVITGHPQAGFEKLRGQPGLEWSQLMMVYQHHEKLDGSGYPVQCVGDDIHWFAKLCAVVDIFDAMTCARAYRKPANMSDVVDHLERLSDGKLDKEMVDCWITTIRSTRR